LHYLSKLEANTYRRLAAAIEGLVEVPPLGDIRPLKGQAGVYRLRVGGFRVLFRVDHQEEVVFVDAIGSRGDVYK
jgi:mRNA interferase RelE/StbE